MSCELCGQKSMNCDCTPLERDLSEKVDRLESQLQTLQDALEKSVKLQSHYAELLNMHDGGERLQFADADAWIKRLNDLCLGSQASKNT
jgi:hypothetical protein